ncbi:conjugal transfer protein TraP [Salmonella enterica]
MANNVSSRHTCHSARYVVARVLRGLFWCLKYAVILPLATMALMALFVLWKDNTTPGKLLVKEINFVRQTAPAGQFPVSECWFSSSDSSGRAEIQDICHYRAADAAEYVREADRSLMQLVSALWVTLALMYMSFAAGTGKYPMWPGEMKCVRGDRINGNNGDKNEHA